ncbi:type-F conjugative transfer system pilin assembly protein TrbC [Asticcacaulis excentricus]|uniref:Type-F conjugative transfer system pilin assembly protein TrbC n=1 Tax=Asticcacaulis excentricus (strain ATCC 15261 / DSM 4724 / KCTC 12464 / NCIMB 9791 / VKM B-1370 / CB 48) TaxID=573065 RepID=E8RVY3_ASTEC|nr:type-F conjugative transfer system pilin assembly protein TrbC [Asticcacaulis excentricus]ADU15405.1 type-F conjugative transfer system pilin assembly protein TrbC [Asticcacaulis excentricus CB 48]
MHSDPKLKTLACAVGALLLLSGPTPAQENRFEIEDLVKSAQARSDAMKADLTGLNASTVEKTKRYAQDAIQLAKGNRERLRTGLTYLGKQYDIDFFDTEAEVEGGVVYVAVSLSMPREALRQLSADAQKAGAVLVIRGFVGGSFKTTRQILLKTFSEEAAAGVLIDPRVFQQYRIDRVPSFVAANTPVASCEDGGLECARTDVPFDLVRGNIPLATALKVLAEKGDAAPRAARTAMDRLESSL